MKDFVKYNKDYYENGIKKGLSGYENYRWIPTRSFEEASTIMDTLEFISPDATILDYGCAKGYLVHALRRLGLRAYGEDISDYALKNCHPNVIGLVGKPTDKQYDVVLCKDVLEHITEEDLSSFLPHLKTRGKLFIIAVPLADDGKYRILSYETDKTHVTKQDEEWWCNSFRKAGFKIKQFGYNFGNLKKKWVEDNPYGNGFFLLTK